METSRGGTCRGGRGQELASLLTPFPLPLLTPAPLTSSPPPWSPEPAAPSFLPSLLSLSSFASAHFSQKPGAQKSGS